MTESVADLLATARDAVRVHADAITAAFFARDHTVTRKADRTLVTDTDTDAERAMRSLIARRYPTHDILGEELGASSGVDASHNYRWVLDPIDGTSNFVLGIPIIVSAAAVVQGDRLVAAAVYQPLLNDMYSAAVGEGAWLNDQPLRIDTTTDLQGATIGLARRRDAYIPTGQVVDLIEANTTATFRVFGSGVFTICQVAASRLNAMVALRQHLWDVLPGLLIAQEAGAVALQFNGSPWTQQSEELVLAHPDLAQELVAVLSATKE